MPATFEPIRETTRRFGTNSYLEVQRKRLRDESGRETEFLVVTRGFFDAAGAKRWTKFVPIPDDPEVKAWLARAVLET